MAFVRVLHDLVGTRYEQGTIVAEELLSDVERLIGLGAVERVGKKEAAQEPEVVTAESEATPKQEPSTVETVVVAEPEEADETKATKKS